MSSDYLMLSLMTHTTSTIDWTIACARMRMCTVQHMEDSGMSPGEVDEWMDTQGSPLRTFTAVDRALTMPGFSL